MSIKRLAKRINKKMMISLGTLLLSAVLIVGFAQVVLFKINQNRDLMVNKLKQAFELPITFNSIEARWFGLSLGVSLKEVVVLDPAVPVPFAAIENVVIFPDIPSLLLKDESHLKKMVLKNVELVMGWDAKNNLSILGLQGENLPTSVDYKTFMALLSKLKTLAIVDAKIKWQSSYGEIKQLLSGQFDWIEAKKDLWQFVGTQQLQMREGLNLPKSDFNLKALPGGIELKLTASGFLTACELKSGTPWHVDCGIETNGLNLAEMHDAYQPLKTDLPLLQWLYKALPSGKITKTQINLNGAFEDLKVFGEIYFKNTDFQYASGWPKIEKAKGVVTIEPARVRVNLSKGSVMGAVIHSATAQISPMGGAEKPVVSVEGSINSTLEKGLLFLQNSPLRTSVAEHLENLNPRGLMGLNLKCAIPLDTKPVKVDGSIVVKNGQLHVPGWHLNLNQLNGSFQFSEAALNASNVKAQLGYLPITVNLKTRTIEKQKNLEMTAQTRLSAAFLQKEFPNAFFQKLKGESLLTVLLNKSLAKNTLYNWVLSSDLVGMEIQLPAFLGKTKNEHVPMTLKIDKEMKGERNIELQLLKRLNAKLTIISDIDHLSLKNGSLDGPWIKGSFVVSSKQIDVDLAYLKIRLSKVLFDTKGDYLFRTFANRPIYFSCKDLQYNQGNFGEVSFKLIPAVYGYQIQNLLLETPLSELSGNGEWHLAETGAYTTLQGRLKSINMGKTLSRWDYPSAIRESSGMIQYQFRWPKHPFQFKLGIVDGVADLKFDQGRILGVDPGLGRIMGLLNLENIYRRLRLDFSDLVKKGFVFDTLKGRFQFQNGVAKTDNVSIDGPSAKIGLAGLANMNTKTIDLEMLVTPHMGTGLPLAAAIAVGNPAVGAGIWILDKLTGSKINKITRHRYQVTGTWESPQITEGVKDSSTQK